MHLTEKDIIHHRLAHQQVSHTGFTTPQQLVASMCAMQAQDYTMAKWAIGLRLPNINEADVEQAFNSGIILRTHLLRPTWHWVTPADIRWLLTLTAPQVHAVNAYQYRRYQIDKKLFSRSNKIFIKALQGGNHLTRTELKEKLEEAKINTDDIRLTIFLMYAELEGIICSGPRVGKQFTYALLDERVPPAKPITRPEAIANLAATYFTSRGPATLHDFSWWSGLSIKDAREGITGLSHDFIKQTFNGKEYIFKPFENIKESSPTFLMPIYDEYIISYKDRSVIIDETTRSEKGNNLFGQLIIVNGKSAGLWQRPAAKTMEVATSFFKPLNKTNSLAVNKAVKRYTSFLTSPSLRGAKPGP